MSPWKGTIKGFEVGQFKEFIKRARRLPLKPMQKVDLLAKYVFPRYTYGLITSTPSRGVLQEIDQVVRTEVKEILHLPHTINSSFLYTPRRERGLGLLEFECMVLIAALWNGLKTQESRDLVTRAAMSSEKAIARLSSFSKALRLEWPPTIKQLDEYKSCAEVTPSNGHNLNGKLRTPKSLRTT